MLEINLTNLCYYDRRNPDFCQTVEFGADQEDFDKTGNFAAKNCSCDTCFYGKSKLTEQLIEMQKTLYTAQDMIDFSEWLDRYTYVYEGSKTIGAKGNMVGIAKNKKYCRIDLTISENNQGYTTLELLKLWKEETKQQNEH